MDVNFCVFYFLALMLCHHGNLVDMTLFISIKQAKDLPYTNQQNSGLFCVIAYWPYQKYKINKFKKKGDIPLYLWPLVKKEEDCRLYYRFFFFKSFSCIVITYFQR